MVRTTKTEKKVTILSAMNNILNAALGSHLEPALLLRAEEDFKFMEKKLKMNQNQCIILSLLMNAGHPNDTDDIARALHVTNLTVMCMDDDFAKLCDKGYIAKINESTYLIPDDVIHDLKFDMPYKAPCLKGLSEEEFFNRFSEIVDDPRSLRYPTKAVTIDRLVKENLKLPLVKKFQALNLACRENSYIFLLAMSEMVNEGNNLTLDTIKDFLEGCKGVHKIIGSITAGKNALIKMNLLEDAGTHFMGMKSYRLTYEAKEEFLPGCEFQNMVNPNNRKDIIHWDTLADIPLFYNRGEKEKMEQLADLLSDEKLSGIQQRLREKGEQPGFACLLYGPAGTGKTQSVKWLSRATQRDIMKVDLAGTRNCLVGETEKITRGIFTTYKKLCKNSSRIPILFLNECDGMLSKRLENIRNSVDQMSNTVQNIILEQLENFEGILIATTNLTCTMGDDATFRRFLYKVKLSVPDADTRSQIWRSKFTGLDAAEANSLAKEFCLSGGLIENISRKAQVEEVLYGKEVTMDQLRQFCKDELSVNNRGNYPSIGFNVV